MPPGTPLRREARSRVAGIGPYRLTSRRRGQAYALARRTRFALPGVPAGNADQVTGVVIGDAATRMGRAFRGTIDASEGEPRAASLPRLRSEYKDRYREFPTLTTRAVTFDATRAPFRDPRARRAIAFALDEQTLARLEEGFLTPSCNLLPPQVNGYRALDPCPFGPREGNSDLVRAEQLARRARAGRTRVLVDAGVGSDAPALARYGVDTLDKIGMRARRARTPAERRRAQLRFASIRGAGALPAAWFGALGDSDVAAEARTLAASAGAASATDRWAALDRSVVTRAVVAPYGVQTTGVLLSERLDGENCLRHSPLFGTDWSSLCVK